jgi:clan AA aspartic protease
VGTVYAEITLKNVFDAGKARKGLMKEQNVRSATITAIVDTGAMSLVLPEELRQKLGLDVTGERTARIADDRRVSCKVTEPVEVHWKNRDAMVRAVIIPGAETVLLGAIPLEEMDLIVNPTTQELAGAHGDVVEFMAL